MYELGGDITAPSGIMVIMEKEDKIDLTSLNTFRVAATADHYVAITQKDDLLTLLKDEPEAFPILVLGEGSNILLTKHFPGWVLHNQIKGIQIEKEDSLHVWLRINSGENWHDVVQYSLEHNLGGIENLSLIPGTVGAAPIQNIGAYGVEFNTVMTSLNAVDLISGKMTAFSNAQCEFGYRDSVFKHKVKNRYFITDVTIKLDKNPKYHIQYKALQTYLTKYNITPDINTISQAVIHIRNSKLPDPCHIPNAGSFFKNPLINQQQTQDLLNTHSHAPLYPMNESHSKIPAAWLIDQCGLKGIRHQQVGTHSEQAVVIVNHGSALGADIAQFAKHIQRTVHTRFGIWLEPEVNIL